jgi:hypothetical protein
MRVGEHTTCTSADAKSCTCDKGWGGEDCGEPRCNGGGGGGVGGIGGFDAGVGGCVHGKCLTPPFCTCEEGYTVGLYALPKSVVP